MLQTGRDLRREHLSRVPKDASENHHQGDRSWGGEDAWHAGQGAEFRFEPTVAGAVRRYWWLVLVLTLIGGIGGERPISFVQHKEYTSQASLAIPPPTSQQLLGSTAAGATSEYIAGQVATLKAPAVANAAARIVHQRLGKGPSGATITKNAVITPPVNAGNGSSASEAATATIAYTARQAKVAAATANAIATVVRRGPRRPAQGTGSGRREQADRQRGLH